MRPAWAVNEAFNRKVGQAPFEIVHRHRFLLSDLSVLHSRETEGISMALGTLHPEYTPCLGPIHKISLTLGRKKLQIGAVEWGKLKEAVMARSRPGKVAWIGAERAVRMLVWLKLSPQQPGLPGDGRDISYCVCREVLY